MAASKAKAPALSESDVIERLRTRYSERSGNGEAWAFIPKVRSAAAFDSRRTIDAYAMSLWPSRGLTLTAFEVKSARSDWLREMRNPAKAEEFCELADHFYLVTGARDIVAPGELPPTWGLMVPHGAGLRVEVEAPALRPADDGDLPPAFSRSFLAALLRAACQVGGGKPQDIIDAESRGREGAQREAATEAERQAQSEAALRKRIRDFEQAFGMPIESRHPEWSAEDMGRALRLVLKGEHDTVAAERRLRQVRTSAQRVVDDLDWVAEDEAQTG
jgi:hypothetical protein